MTLYPIVADALCFATASHHDQVRKYTGEPYIVHPIEVMMLVKNHVEDQTPEMLAAALLHDVVEDTTVRAGDVHRMFGPDVAIMVEHLTDMYTKEAHPDINRERRKWLEASRLAITPSQVQTIKYADLISNAKSIAQYDPSFAKVYFREKRALLYGMVDGDKVLRQMALDITQKWEASE